VLTGEGDRIGRCTSSLYPEGAPQYAGPLRSCGELYVRLYIPAQALARTRACEILAAVSQVNLDAVRDVLADWERGDWASSAELFDPDLEVVFSTTSFPDAGTYHGGRAVLDAWGRWLEAWDEFSMEFDDVIARGERIVALNRLHGRGKESGVPVDAEVGVVFECAGGVVKRMVFCDRREALEAADAAD
jgi:ketosteroid isomerase-like protein